MMRFQPKIQPFPSVVITGRLRLAGVDELTAIRITNDIISSSGTKLARLDIGNILSIARDVIVDDSTVLKHLDIIINYEFARVKDPETPPIILCLEGASATGKSILSLMLIGDVVASRILSTDTVRQILRGYTSPDVSPELFCHTYQAHKYRQAGPHDLNPVVRGFIAQCKVIQPVIRDSVQLISDEGAQGLVEGVHLIPGDFGSIRGVLEILVDPEYEIHQSMFMNKRFASGLRTITHDDHLRAKEFEATRDIQDYLRDVAESQQVPIVRLSSFESAVEEIRSHILNMMSILAA